MWCAGSREFQVSPTPLMRFLGKRCNRIKVFPDPEWTWCKIGTCARMRWFSQASIQGKTRDLNRDATPTVKSVSHIHVMFWCLYSQVKWDATQTCLMKYYFTKSWVEASVFVNVALGTHRDSVLMGDVAAQVSHMSCRFFVPPLLRFQSLIVKWHSLQLQLHYLWDMCLTTSTWNLILTSWHVSTPHSCDIRDLRLFSCFKGPVGLMAQLVWRHSCVADRLPVVVRIPAGPWVRLGFKRTVPQSINGRTRKKNHVSKDQHVFEISHFAPIFSHLIFPFRPVAASSCRTPCSLSKPYCNRYGSSSSVDPISGSVRLFCTSCSKTRCFWWHLCLRNYWLLPEPYSKLTLNSIDLSPSFCVFCSSSCNIPWTLWALCQRSTSIDSYDFTYAYPAVQMRGLNRDATPTVKSVSRCFELLVSYTCHVLVPLLSSKINNNNDHTFSSSSLPTYITSILRSGCSPYQHVLASDSLVHVDEKAAQLRCALCVFMPSSLPNSVSSFTPGPQAFFQQGPGTSIWECLQVAQVGFVVSPTTGEFRSTTNHVARIRKETSPRWGVTFWL